MAYDVEMGNMNEVTGITREKDPPVPMVVELHWTEMIATKEHVTMPVATQIRAATIAIKSNRAVVVQISAATGSDREAGATREDVPGVEVASDDAVVAGIRKEKRSVAVVAAGKSVAVVRAGTGVGHAVRIEDFDVVEAQIGCEPEVVAEPPVTVAPGRLSRRSIKSP